MYEVHAYTVSWGDSTNVRLTWVMRVMDQPSAAYVWSESEACENIAVCVMGQRSHPDKKGLGTGEQYW